MALEGIIDYQSAKTKAIERLGLPENSARPDNREVEGALLEYLTLFEANELEYRRTRWREVAVEAMTLLQQFNTYLVGATLSGTITRFSRVQILAIASPEHISMLLYDMEIPFEQEQRRLRRSTKEYCTIQSFRFIVEEVNVEILCVQSDDFGRSLVSPVDGKPFRRASLNEVRHLLNNEVKVI